MTAVTIERLLQDTPQPTTTADDRLLPLSQVAEQIANLTGQSAELITNGILSTGAVRVRNGEWVVPSNIGDAAIDSYAADLAARMKSQIRNGAAEIPQAEPVTSSNGTAAIVDAPTVEPEPKPAAQTTTAKSAAKKTSAKKTTTKKLGRPAAKKADPQPEVEAEAAPTA